MPRKLFLLDINPLDLQKIKTAPNKRLDINNMEE